MKNTDEQFKAIMKYWDGLTPQVRAKVWYYLTGHDHGQIGDQFASMGEQAIADHIGNTLTIEDLYDMVSHAEFAGNIRTKRTPASV